MVLGNFYIYTKLYESYINMYKQFKLSINELRWG